MAKAQSDGTRDAIGLLMEDHKRLQKLFRDFRNAQAEDDEILSELVETACMEVQIHAILEEELFYPAVRAHLAEGDDAHQSFLNEAEVEHESVDELVAKLQELEPDDAMYAAYFNVLAEYVKNHIRKEEKELFPEAKKMQELDLQQLGEDMRLRREQLFGEIEAGAAEGETDTAVPQDDLAAVEDEYSEEETEDEQEQIDISRTRH
ncbi:MAG TPA: hemerythrin domain-containing protein [Burkholderiales bacterium]|nr:hemerythrin domain-containing protein [Burkholderiales bacterium]